MDWLKGAGKTSEICKETEKQMNKQQRKLPYISTKPSMDPHRIIEFKEGGEIIDRARNIDDLCTNDYAAKGTWRQPEANLYAWYQRMKKNPLFLTASMGY